ncbi:MAG: hypothetical protein GY832_09520, partial [Chloroflexi bacterium]|nr:hypothetical protein [Chloroflexota bacterium]
MAPPVHIREASLFQRQIQMTRQQKEKSFMSLDEVIGVAPLDNAAIQAMVGNTYGAVVFKSDVSMNYGPTEANLTGGRRGRFTFTVLDAQPCGALHP